MQGLYKLAKFQNDTCPWNKRENVMATEVMTEKSYLLPITGLTFVGGVGILQIVDLLGDSIGWC